jgi:hypothetical protein
MYRTNYPIYIVLFIIVIVNLYYISGTYNGNHKKYITPKIIDSEAPQFPGYTFTPGVGFEHSVFGVHTTSNQSLMADECNSDTRCKGFQSNGHLKYAIPPKNTWSKWDEWLTRTPIFGLYVKE